MLCLEHTLEFRDNGPATPGLSIVCQVLQMQVYIMTLFSLGCRAAWLLDLENPAEAMGVQLRIRMNVHQCLDSRHMLRKARQQL